jgi:RsiW-degrading membrane proteinase PrsW (M82 family)
MRSGARAALSSLGLILLVVGLSMTIGGFDASATRPAGESSAAQGIVAAIGLLLLLGGWACAFVSFPTATALGGLIVAAIALLSADGLFVASVVLHQADPGTFDPLHAATVARVGAALCLVAAVLLIGAWIVWRRRRGAGARVYHALSALTVGCGAWVFFVALELIVSAVLLIPKLGDLFDTGFGGEMAVVGLLTLGAAGGGLLLWHGAAALTGAGASRYRPPSPWLLFGLAAGAIGLGALLIQTQTGFQIVPLLYPIGIVVPGAAILALVSWMGRRGPALQRTTWRDMLLMIGWGMVGAAAIAVVLELAAQQTLLLLRLASQGAFQGITNGSDYRDAIQNAQDTLSDRELLIQALLNIALFGPLIEEFCKGFGVRLLRGVRPTRHQAFLFGVAAGVGFGMVEAYEYSLGAFVYSPYHWWDTLLVRGGSSSLHALASGTVGLAWFYAFSGRRLRALALFGAAVALHGSWNALNVLAAAHVLPGFHALSDQTVERVLEVVCCAISLVLITVLCRLSARLAAHDGEPPTPQVVVASLDAAPSYPTTPTTPLPQP